MLMLPKYVFIFWYIGITRGFQTETLINLLFITQDISVHWLCLTAFFTRSYYLSNPSMHYFNQIPTIYLADNK